MEVFRCGWCGAPTTGDGAPLPHDQIHAWIDAEWDSAKMVNGTCCPNGDGSNMRDRQREEWEREMRRDAFGAA